MKKIVLFIGLIVLGLSAYSQQLKFSKGSVVPGKFSYGRDFENFITGKIKVTDANGVEYTFVQAEFTMETKTSKNVQFTLTTNLFPENQISQILAKGNDGATYTFDKIIVKDATGKQVTLAAVEFIYDPHVK